MTIRDMNNLPSHFTVFGEPLYYAEHFKNGEWIERRTVSVPSIRTRNPMCLNWRVIDIYSDNGVCVEAES